MNTANADSQHTTNIKPRFFLFCTCGLVVVLFTAIRFLHPNKAQNGENIDEQLNLRLIADEERKAWEEENSKQAEEENKELQAKSIPELSKLAVDILAKSSNPDYIVSTAIASFEENDGGTITIPPWQKLTEPENNKFWAIIYRKTVDEGNDWWIEKNTWFGQYRLVGKSNQRIYFSIRREKKLRSVLTNHCGWETAGLINAFYPSGNR